MSRFQQLLDEANRSYKTDVALPCPFHVVRKGDGSIGQEVFASFFMNKSKGMAHCFGCGVGGSFAKIKAMLDGVPFEQAKQELYGNDLPPWVELEKEEEVYDPVYNDSFLKPFAEAGEIPERGIKEESSRLYGIRSDTNSNLLLPYRDYTGNLRGLQVRYHNPTEDTNWYDQLLHFRRGQFLFGEHLWKTLDTSIVALTEGAFDAVKLQSSLGILSLAVNGSSVTSSQVTTLSKMGIKQLVWWRDNDLTGEQNLERNWKRLRKIVRDEVYVPVFEAGDKKDPSEMEEEDIRRLWDTREWYPRLNE